MAFSQNGGLVVENGDPRLLKTVIPGTNGLKYIGGIMGADLNTIVMYWGYRWHTEIEPIDRPADVCGLWGHNKRPVRGSTSGWSNHAAGEGWDTWAARHPLGTKTLSKAQLGTLKRMVADLDGVVRAGAFYSGRVDEMHAERAGSYAQVAVIATRIRNGQLPNVPDELLVDIPKKPTPPPDPKPPLDPDPPMPEEDEMVRLMKLAGDPRRLCADFGAHTFWHVTSQDQYDWLRDALGIPELQGDQAPWTLEGFVDISGK